MLEYRVGRPGWKLAARLGVALKANVSVVYDYESNMLVAACSDFAPYLDIVTEGRTFEELTGKLNDCFETALEEALRRSAKVPRVTSSMTLVEAFQCQR